LEKLGAVADPQGGWGAPAPLQAATSIGTRELEEEKVKREEEEEEEEGFSPPYGCDLDPPLPLGHDLNNQFDGPNKSLQCAPTGAPIGCIC